jgi:acetyltransferase-like isoleucine patch superfamily enzyme
LRRAIAAGGRRRRIGDHTVVAAWSVVRGDLPSRVLAAGNPAKVVKQLEIPGDWRRELASPAAARRP